MKNVFYFWICMAVWLLSACSSQKKGDGEDVQVLMKDSVDANGLQRMQVSDSKMSFTYNGKEYHSHVVRRPDDSLPVVTNEQGEKFVSALNNTWLLQSDSHDSYHHIIGQGFQGQPF